MSATRQCEGLPDNWETDRDDEFEQYTGGLVRSYDGTVYADPSKNTIRFESTVQLLRFIHYETGRPIDELWDEYETELEGRTDD